MHRDDGDRGGQAPALRAMGVLSRGQAPALRAVGVLSQGTGPRD